MMREEVIQELALAKINEARAKKDYEVKEVGVAASNWGTKKYLEMARLYDMEKGQAYQTLMS